MLKKHCDYHNKTFSSWPVNLKGLEKGQALTKWRQFEKKKSSLDKPITNQLPTGNIFVCFLCSACLKFNIALLFVYLPSAAVVGIRLHWAVAISCILMALYVLILK